MNANVRFCLRVSITSPAPIQCKYYFSSFSQPPLQTAQHDYFNFLSVLHRKLNDVSTDVHCYVWGKREGSPSKKFSISSGRAVNGKPRSLMNVSCWTRFWRFMQNSNSSGLALKTKRRIAVDNWRVKGFLETHFQCIDGPRCSCCIQKPFPRLPVMPARRTPRH